MKWVLLFGSIAAAVGVACWKYLPTDRNGKGVAPTRLAEAAVPAAPGMQGVGYVEPVSEVRKLMMRTGGVIKQCRV
jgi:hypothetical protein